MQVFNFSAGPAVLPKEVLQRAAAEMLDWHGSGMSVMEMSHRGPEFISIAAKAEADLRKLLAISEDYEVLFLQGGAVGENAIVPMNLLGEKKVIDFVNTGEWSKKSIKEAKKYAQVNIAASSEDKNFSYVPARESWKLTARPSTTLILGSRLLARCSVASTTRSDPTAGWRSMLETASLEPIAICGSPTSTEHP